MSARYALLTKVHRLAKMLAAEGNHSILQLSRSLSLSRVTVRKYTIRIQESGLSFKEFGALSQKEMEGIFLRRTPISAPTKRHEDLALGYPALAMEANAFKPDPRMREGAADRPGLARCLTGEAAVAECIIPAAGDLPARVWVGDTAGRRHLDRLDRVSDVVAGCKADFRFVLVDIPPLLLSADAEILARNLQHLMLVVEAAGVTGGELRRAGRQLERVAPAAVGAVVNRVQPFSGGGYLREMQLEYLTGRKTADYFTEPGWQTALRAGLSALPAWLLRTPKFFTRKSPCT